MKSTKEDGNESLRCLLEVIQRRLEQVYDLSLSGDVGDYLCERSVATAALGERDLPPEVLVVRQEGEDVELGLFVDPTGFDAPTFAARCLAIEGVSHFAFVLFRASQSFGVSQLELELQAEVDKYVSELLGLGRVAKLAPISCRARNPCISPSPPLDDTPVSPRLTDEKAKDSSSRHARSGVWQHDLGHIPLEGSRSRALRHRLYDRVRFLHDPSTTQGDRYRKANRFAAQYAKKLEATYVSQGDQRGFIRELRRYYRLGLSGKIAASQ